MSVQGSLEGDPRAPVLAASEPADTRPVNWGQAAAANWRLLLDDDQAGNYGNLVKGYNDLEDALVRTGRPRTRYRNSDWGNYLQPVETAPQRYAALWADVEAARAANPKAFADLPATRKEFETWAYARKGKRAADMQVAAKGGFGSMIVPSLVFGLARMAEPENLAQIPLGGGGSTVSGMLARQFAAGVLGQALQTPELVRARANMGEGYSPDEMARDLAIGGAVNAAFVAVPTLAGKGAAAVHDYRMAHSPGYRDSQLVDAFKRSVKGDWEVTPQQAAAVHVLTRAAEVDLSSPYVGKYSAIEAHASKIQAVLDQLAAAPAPARPAMVAAPAVRTAAETLDRRIAGYFRNRGYSDAQARGIAAGIHAESGSNPAALNPASGALGIGQWLGSRKDALIRRFGPHPTLEQQLEFMHSELQGGDHGGASVLAQTSEAAVLDAYIRKFMRPAEGAETTGDLSRGMAALGRPGETADLAGEFDPLLIRPAALDAVRPQVSAGGREIPLGSFAPAEIGVDAGLMQFKAGGDAAGVTERLRGIEQWDPMAAGMVTIWEGNDGRRLIADGHQRLGLARRLQAADPAQDIRLNAFVLREADGFTAQDARVLTALKNIGEGSGTASDAAKVFRDVGLDPDVLRRLPPRSVLVRDGKALARLSDEAFGAVINEVIPESSAAVIGHLAPDPATHMALVDLLARLDPPNRRQAEAIVRQALDAGFHGEHQDELFGARELVTSLFAAKAKALDRTLGELRKLKGAFSVAARNADALDAAGNKIDVGASEAAARGNAEALGLVEKLALRKGNAVNDLFNQAAQRLADGEPIGRVVRDIVAELRTLDLAQALDDGRALRDAGGAGDGPGGSGRDGFADGQAGSASEGPADLTPATRDELEAAGQGGFALFDDPGHQAFSDPAGEGVQQAADSAWHDIRAAAQPVHPGTGETIDQVRQRAEDLRNQFPPTDSTEHAGTHNISGSAIGADGLSRGELRRTIAGQMLAEPARQERVAHLVLGPPAAGKSSFADPLAQHWGARIIDADMAKARLPEYADGIGALAVHEESSRIALAAEQASIDQGDNILLPLVGKTFAGLENRINDLVKQNYRVYVHLVDLPIDKAAERAMARFSETGRFVDPQYVRSVGTAPSENYKRLVAHFGDKLEGYSHVSNEVARGEAPRLVEASGAERAGGPGRDRGSGLSQVERSPGGGSAEQGARPAGQDVSQVRLDSGAAVDPSIAARRAQEARLRAEAPLRGENKTGQAQDGTIGAPLFDAADAPRFDLEDGKGPRTIAEIDAELAAEQAGIDAIKGCLL